MRRAITVAVAACSTPPVAQPARPASGVALLAALPPQAPVDTGKLSGIVVCARCHAAGDRQMRDEAGADISPVGDLASSLMGLSARDPYYLAALRRELHVHPDQRDAILPLCVRCHAPVGFAADPALGLGQLEASVQPAALLGREGAGCAGCHAMSPTGLGEESTFAGRARLRTDRVSYGALVEPMAEAMEQMVKTRVEHAPHMTESKLCASCHTVLIPNAGTGGEVGEQTTYLEWEASGFASPRMSQTCQDCHMPAVEQATLVAFSTRPPGSPLRPGFVRHTLRGGNAYLLDQLARATTWLGAPVEPRALERAAADTRDMLAHAATLDMRWLEGSSLRVTVTNLTGHKLPTGFPTRRIWLHVVAYDERDHVVFESGAHRGGAIVGAGGRRLDVPGAILPHRARIASADEVAIWEAVPVDAAGVRTHVLRDAVRFAKDDRILPTGFRPDGRASAARLGPIGVDGDAGFGSGTAEVTIILPEAAKRADAELLYQAIPPETLESYRASDSPEAARFLEIAMAPPSPEVIAKASWTARPPM